MPDRRRLAALAGAPQRLRLTDSRALSHRQCGPAGWGTPGGCARRRSGRRWAGQQAVSATGRPGRDMAPRALAMISGLRIARKRAAAEGVGHEAHPPGAVDPRAARSACRRSHWPREPRAREPHPSARALGIRRAGRGSGHWSVRASGTAEKPCPGASFCAAFRPTPLFPPVWINKTGPGACQADAGS